MGTVTSPGPCRIHASVGTGEGEGVGVSVKDNTACAVTVAAGERGVEDGTRGMTDGVGVPLQAIERKIIPNANMRFFFHSRPHVEKC